jgi:hypothetical protein
MIRKTVNFTSFRTRYSNFHCFRHNFTHKTLAKKDLIILQQSILIVFNSLRFRWESFENQDESKHTSENILLNYYRYS